MAAIASFVLFAVGIGSRQSFAQDAQAQALELSDHAFAMLNRINASSPPRPGPILAPAASLAGDAQTLSTRSGAHDNAAASGAMASVLSDRDKIEAAAKIAGGQYPEQWTDIGKRSRRSKSRCHPAKGSASASSSEPCRNRMRRSRRRPAEANAGPAEDRDRFASLPGRNGAGEGLPSKAPISSRREFSTATPRARISTSRARRAINASISISRSSSPRRRSRFA